MRLNAIALLTFSTIFCLAPACDDPKEGDGEDGDGGGGQAVYVTEWKTAVETKFVADDRGDEVDIEELTIGGPEKEGNFVNRGDIEVYYNTSNKIRVEYRKFTIANTKDEAEGNLAKFFFWSWAKDQPSPPGDLLEKTPELECNDEHWNEGCHIRAWYEGQKQPDRIGMDFRVFLPEDWSGKLNLITEDNMAEKEVYPDRSDITVDGVVGPLNILGEGGNVNIARPNGSPEVVDCSSGALKNCQDIGWADIGNECECDQFGTIIVEMSGAANVNIALSNDSMLTQVDLNNTDDTLKESSDPLCTAFFDCDGMKDCDSPDDVENPWKTNHFANVPGDAQQGIGFSVKVDVKACAESEFVTGKDDFGSPKSEARGFINVCAKSGGKCPEIKSP